MKRFFYAIIAVFVCSAKLFSADPANFPAIQKKFIRSLYNDKRYFDSIAEARRLQVEDNSPELDYFIYIIIFWRSSIEPSYPAMIISIQNPASAEYLLFRCRT